MLREIKINAVKIPDKEKDQIMSGKSCPCIETNSNGDTPKSSSSSEIDYEAKLKIIYANPTPAQATLIAAELKHRQIQAAKIANLNAWGPYEFYITVAANPAVTDPQEFQSSLKKLLKAVNQILIGHAVHPDNNPMLHKAAILLGYVTLEYGHQIYVHITCRAASGFKRFSIDDITGAFLESSRRLLIKGTAIPVFDSNQALASLVEDLGGSEYLARHNLRIVHRRSSDSRLEHGTFYSMFGRNLERLF